MASPRLSQLAEARRAAALAATRATVTSDPSSTRTFKNGTWDPFRPGFSPVTAPAASSVVNGRASCWVIGHALGECAIGPGQLCARLRHSLAGLLDLAPRPHAQDWR